VVRATPATPSLPSTPLFRSETGRLRVVSFNQPWREQQLRTAGDVALFGKPERYQGRLQMTNPVVDLLGDRTGRIVPVYPQSDRRSESTRLNSSHVKISYAVF